MTDQSRHALRALAQQHGLSDDSLRLIMEAAVRLTDTQIRMVIDAVETCVLSGLTERDIAQVIAEHRRLSPADWRSGFWAERVSLASENYNRQQADAAAANTAAHTHAQGPPPVAIEPEPPQRRPATRLPVSPIPPQPPSQVGGGRAPAAEPGNVRQPNRGPAKQAA
jgi:hypothetical protein